MVPNAIYRIKSFNGGLSDFANKGIAGSFRFGSGLDIRGSKDVLTCNNKLEKESGNTITDLINFIIPASDGNSYHFGNSGKIYKRTSASAWSLVYTDANGAILGACEWNGYFYWATATVLNEMIISGNWTTDVNSVANWPKTLISATWHSMRVACGDLMICNDKYLAMVDTTGAFTDQALQFNPIDISTCLDDDGDYVIVGSKDKGNAERGQIYTWQTSALNYINKKKLASKGVNALISAELMLAQVGVLGEVYFSDMMSKIPLFTFPFGGYVIPGGVDNKKGLCLFGVYGTTGNVANGVYSYGRAKKNFPFALNLDYVPSAGIDSNLGAVAMVNGTLLVAWKSGTTYGVDALSATVKANGVYESLEWDGNAPHKAKTFQQVKISMEPLASGCSIVLKYKINNAASWTTAKTVDAASSFSVAGATKAIFSINKLGELIELRVELTVSTIYAPIIKSINTYLSMIGSKMANY